MPLSTLESLPGEIIEIIFLDAFEVNLARASNVIAAAVSREAVYDIFMIQALWNDPQDCFRPRPSDSESIYCDMRCTKRDYQGCPGFQSELRIAAYRPLLISDQRVLQQKVMACRWFNVHRLKRALPTLLALTLDAIMWQEHLRFPSKDVQRREWSGASAIETLRAQQMWTNDGYPKRLRVMDHFAIEAEYIAPEHGRRHIIRSIRLFLLPDKALHGLWSDEKVDLLVALRRAFGKRFTRHDLSCSAMRQQTLAPVFCGMACSQGIKDAIAQGNRTALLYLLDIRENFQPMTPNILLQSRFSDQLLKLATHTRAPDLDIIDLLVRANPSFARGRNLVKWTVATSLPRNLAKTRLLCCLQRYGAPSKRIRSCLGADRRRTMQPLPEWDALVR
ncbi:hypothetical protein N7505_007808 [Penicillium chrysogenum]|uniref:F-box domain-containing protein n=1 Tax=Penicillium chrysogenum TaxID=5076 RepID=A0ABQ8WF35_PENCH|nr:hypothetical protein N7505_007808 [Penicillium chrysogenum]